MAVSETLVFIATQSEGIHAARMDDATGTLTPIGVVAEVERPTWLALDPQRSRLYATNEVGNAGDRIGDVLSFGIAPADGALTPISRTASAGGGPTHLALEDDGRTLFVANFGGGQVSAMRIDGQGAISPARTTMTNTGSGPHRRQQGPHAHGVTLDPSGRFLLAPDMGADRVFVYAYDAATQELADHSTPFASLPAGSGPRLLLFGPDGRNAYLLTELSAEIVVFRWDQDGGTLAPAGSVALDPAESDAARSAAAFVMSADGRHLYASNRTTHAIHIFAIEPDDGLLDEIQVIDAGGGKPWGAELLCDGRWLLVANQAADEIRLFAVDRASGRLAATDSRLAVPSPTGSASLPL